MRLDGYRTLAIAATLVGLATSAVAVELQLPSGTDGLRARLATECPTCATAGYVACGSADVGWGRRFAPAAFLGDPPRAYLVTFTLTGEEFRARARATDHATLVGELKDRFAPARLVVFERGFRDARVLPAAERVTVRVPEALHACVQHRDRRWGCCVGGCHGECCEKELGSPTVELAWTDGGETLTFHYGHTIGVSWLERRARDRRTRYACLTDAKGTLRSGAARAR